MSSSIVSGEREKWIGGKRPLLCWSPTEKNGPRENENPQHSTKAYFILSYHPEQVQIQDNLVTVISRMDPLGK